MTSKREMNAAEDARTEREHGGAVSVEDARQRAQVRREHGMTDMAKYWDAYAAEVESWDKP